MVIFLGVVLDAQGKPKVSEKDDCFASFVNPTRGIKMDLEMEIVIPVLYVNTLQ